MPSTSSDRTKLRVLVAGHLPPPAGGVATYYQSLLNSSLPQKVDLAFVQTSSQKRALSETGKFSFFNLTSAFSDWARFTRAVIKHRPQVTHIATAFGLSFVKHSVCVLIARLLGSRVLLHPHCGFTALYTNRSRWWQWYFRRVIRHTDGVITLSTEWDQLRSVIPGCKVYFLPNALDLRPYQSIGQARRQVSAKPGEVRVLYLGYLGKEKGSFDLLEAAKQTCSRKLPLAFDLYGEDLEQGEVEQLKQQINQTGLAGVVNLHPFADAPTKVEAFCNADIFIYPSYHEGMPMAVIEAMACGLPVIASKVGGLPDLVEDGLNGLLVEPAHPGQLADALQTLSLDYGLRYTMQQNSFRRAFEQFDMETLVPRLVRIYEQAFQDEK